MAGGAVHDPLITEVFINLSDHRQHASSSLLGWLVVFLHRGRRVAIGTVDPERSRHERHRTLQLTRGHALNDLNVFENLFSRFWSLLRLLCGGSSPRCDDQANRSEEHTSELQSRF